MKDKILRKAIQVLGNTRRCEVCPLDTLVCRTVSISLFGEERCLILVTVSEILAFHTEEHKREAKEFRERAEKEGGK